MLPLVEYRAMAAVAEATVMLPRGGGGKHIFRTCGREIGTRRPVDIGSGGNSVELLLGGRDCGVGILDRLLSGVDIRLRR